ncbi:unnamed protein product [Symbiodinium sp. CCMP2592]|nr:unnamed protein product [Symbiodinium sp. CCMP2592]
MQTLKDLTSSLHDSASLQRLRDNLNELPKRWLARVEQPEDYLLGSVRGECNYHFKFRLEGGGYFQTGVLVASAEASPGGLPASASVSMMSSVAEDQMLQAAKLLIPCAAEVRFPAKGFKHLLCTQARLALKPLETWEEVELHRPKAPTLEGYVRPVGAPEQLDIPREQYHQFMMGKPARYSVELRNFLMGLGVVSFCFAEFAFTVYKLRPDDLDWVDEERKRAAAAKARIEARIAKQESEGSSE